MAPPAWATDGVRRSPRWSDRNRRSSPLTQSIKREQGMIPRVDALPPFAQQARRQKSERHAVAEIRLSCYARSREDSVRIESTVPNSGCGGLCSPERPACSAGAGSSQESSQAGPFPRQHVGCTPIAFIAYVLNGRCGHALVPPAAFPICQRAHEQPRGGCCHQRDWQRVVLHLVQHTAPRAVGSLRKAFHSPHGRLRHRILGIRKNPFRTQARLNGVDRVAHLGARLFDL